MKSISVILPTFNSSDTIEHSINSVLSQSLAPKELIVVDDCSEDNTVQVCKKLLRKKEISSKIIVLEKNMGASFARNYGWNLAIGDWVAFIDSDDIWHQEKLAICHSFLHEQNFLVAHDYSEKEQSFSQKIMRQEEYNCFEITFVAG